MEANSDLERLLRSEKFVITGECGPPQGANVEVIKEKSQYLKGKVDAVNVTDNQTAIVRMSSLATCVILKDMGIEPTLQMVTRDRNRIAIQSDLFGAYALGLRNLLCLTGDHQSFGNHPQSKGVYDLDSIQFIRMVRKMRDENKTLNGDEIDGKTSFFIGAAANPFADPFEIRALRLAKKINAGVEFIQTQCIYDLDKFERWMEIVRKMGLHRKAFILGGVTPLKSVGMARYMKSSVSGIDIPDEVINRLKSVPKEEVSKEGIEICVETIERLKKIEGVAGVHLMAIEWEKKVPEIVEKAGLLPRPIP